MAYEQDADVGIGIRGHSLNKLIEVAHRKVCCVILNDCGVEWTGQSILACSQYGLGNFKIDVDLWSVDVIEILSQSSHIKVISMR